MITQILERVYVLSERYVRKHLEPLGRDDRANEEYAELLGVSLQRDAKHLHKLTIAHIDATMRDLREQLLQS